MKKGHFLRVRTVKSRFFNKYILSISLIAVSLFAFIVLAIDITPPQISFASTSSAINFSGSYIFVNLTSSDDNGLHYVFTNFNNSLMGYWRFENSSGNNVSDESGNGHNMTLIGSVSVVSSGKFGNSSNFTGVNGYAQVTGLNASNWTSGSYSFWAYVNNNNTQYTPDGSQSIIITSGGTVTHDGNYTVVTFNSNSTFNVSSLSSSGNVTVLVVAGGGAGGANAGTGNGGGGGAGGLIYNASYPITPGQNITVTVGGGGAPTSQLGGSGGNSSFGTLNARGGGGGGYYNSVAGAAGGSGGGGPQTSGAAGSGTAGQGNSGGASTGLSGGGGGGAGGVGLASGSYGGGNGGVGLNYTINGSNVYYAGGGGGSAHNSINNQSSGGLGGGGKGQGKVGGVQTVGTDGANGTGGGGGAGGETSGGRSGGSGVVIVRYLNPSNVPLFELKDSNNNTYDSIVVNSTGSIIASFIGSSTVSLSSSLTLGAWHHVAYTWSNNANASLYLDGVLQQSSAVTTHTNSQATQLFLGHNVSSSSFFLNGSMDDVLLFNRALNSSEVSSLYNAQTNQYSNNFTGLGNGQYNLTAMAVDTSGNKNQTTARTYVLDTVNPLVQFVSPQETNGGYVNRNYILINTTASDTNLANITINLYNSTSLVNSTNVTTSPNYVNISGLPDAIYYYNVTAQDFAGNSNSTSTNNITVDTTNPQVSYTTGVAVDNANLSQSNVYINLSIIEVNTANVTFRLFNSSGAYNSSTYLMSNQTSNNTINFTGLAEGVYTYNATVVDLAGNSNSTATRTITLDTHSPSGNLVSPPNGTYSSSHSNNLTANISDNKGIKNVTLNVYNLTGSLVYSAVTSFASGVVNTVVGTVASLADGVYTWFYSIFDWAGNSFNTSNGNLTVDTTNPQISFGSGTQSNGVLLSANSIYVNVSVTEINEANITFSLFNSTSYLNSTTFNNSARTINWTNLPDGVYYYNVTIFDLAGNSNSTATRKITLDTTPPVISDITYYPNSSDDVDPGQNISFNASVVDTGTGVNSVILQYHNGTDWMNESMVNIAGNIYSANITLVSTEENYTFNILATDNTSNQRASDNRTFESAWDCSWYIAKTNLGAFPGWKENKEITNVTIVNTGDPQFADNNCTLTFHLAHNLDKGRIYFDNSPTNKYRNYYDTSSVVAKSNLTVLLNASFVSDIVTSESFMVNVLEDQGLSSTSSLNATGILVSTTNQPYLYEAVESPSYRTASLNLTNGTSLLSAYVQNLPANGSLSTRAYNVSFDWTLPEGFNITDGNLSSVYDQLDDNLPNYNNLSLIFDENNLPSLAPGSYTINLSVYGYDYNGNLIMQAGNTSILNDSISILLSCYNVSDGIQVPACGSLDPDNPVNTNTVVVYNNAGSGGGGGGGGAENGYVQTKADYTITRGKENEIQVPFVNDYPNISYSELTFSVTGNISKYIEVIPKTLSLLAPGQTENITLNITSPSYLPLGIQEVVLHIRGKRGDSYYSEDKSILIQINALPKADAERLLNESRDLIDKLKGLNLSVDKLEALFNDSQTAFDNLEYEKLQSNYDSIKSQVNSALEAYDIINKLEDLIKQAHDEGISTSNAERLLKLAQLSLERADYEQADSRAKDAMNAYALEVKGEIAKLSYYLQNNKKEIGFSLIGLLAFGFVGYKLNRIRTLNRKIRKLKEEEAVLVQLMKLAQDMVFKKRKIDLEEYRESMLQYEKKMAAVIEEMIDSETELSHVLKFTSEEKKLKSEKQRIIELVKQIQGDYLSRGKMESRAYEIKLESYDRRLGEVEEKLAEIEANRALKKAF